MDAPVGSPERGLNGLTIIEIRAAIVNENCHLMVSPLVYSGELAQEHA
jgi:hypothetical protein